MSRVSEVQLYGCRIAAKRRKFTPRGGRVLPHMDYAGMCRWTGYGLSLSTASLAYTIDLIC